MRNCATKGKQVIQGPGENAGVIDIGDDDAIIFKIESHNHPSYIEPYQGAATGVGGILRDVFTMGARPIALLNSIHFGAPEHHKTKSLVTLTAFTPSQRRHKGAQICLLKQQRYRGSQ